MIRYSLSCHDGHDFEGWFASSEAFDDQQAKGGIACPVCGSTSVRQGADGAGGRDLTQRRIRCGLPPMCRSGTEMVAALRKLREHLTENADYVGPKFAEEARRIHYNEAEKRGIYGEASSEEAHALAEEGIEFHPLPVLPEEHN